MSGYIQNTLRDAIANNWSQSCRFKTDEYAKEILLEKSVEYIPLVKNPDDLYLTTNNIHMNILAFFTVPASSKIQNDSYSFAARLNMINSIKRKIDNSADGEMAIIRTLILFAETHVLVKDILSISHILGVNPAIKDLIKLLKVMTNYSVAITPNSCITADTIRKLYKAGYNIKHCTCTSILSEIPVVIDNVDLIVYTNTVFYTLTKDNCKQHCNLLNDILAVLNGFVPYLDHFPHVNAIRCFNEISKKVNSLRQRLSDHDRFIFEIYFADIIQVALTTYLYEIKSLTDPEIIYDKHMIVLYTLNNKIDAKFM
jgi:hypothetical protein